MDKSTRPRRIGALSRHGYLLALKPCRSDRASRPDTATKLDAHPARALTNTAGVTSPSPAAGPLNVANVGGPILTIDV